MFATNSQNVGPTVMCDVRSCDVLFEFCPNTCLQPAVPMLSHLFCVICVAVICCLAPFIPGTVAGMARRAFGYIYIYIYIYLRGCTTEAASEVACLRGVGYGAACRNYGIC